MQRIALLIAAACLVLVGYFARTALDRAGDSSNLPLSASGRSQSSGRASGPPAGPPPAGGAASRPASQPANAPASRQGPAVAVVVAEARRQELHQRVEGSDILRPVRQVDVVARVEGEVEEIFFEEGESAGEGAALCAIDERALAIRAATARIERDRAKAEHARFLELQQRKAASETEVEDARFSMERAGATLEEAQLSLSYARPAAPFEGVIVKRHIEIGQHVQPGDVIFTIADFEPLELRLHLPEREIRAVEVGQEVELRRDRRQEPCARGRVERVSPVVDRESFTVEVTLRFPPVDGLRPGSFVTASIVTRAVDDALVVPRVAVRHEEGKSWVYQVRDGYARRIPVVIGLTEGDHVEIAEGLDASSVVVTNGWRELQDGSPVQIHRVLGRTP